MNREGALKIVREQDRELDNSKRMNTQTVSREYVYVYAKGFLEGYEQAVRDAAQIADHQKWYAYDDPCNCGEEIKQEILSLLPKEWG